MSGSSSGVLCNETGLSSTSVTLKKLLDLESDSAVDISRRNTNQTNSLNLFFKGPDDSLYTVRKFN